MDATAAVPPFRLARCTSDVSTSTWRFPRWIRTSRPRFAYGPDLGIKNQPTTLVGDYQQQGYNNSLAAWTCHLGHVAPVAFIHALAVCPSKKQAAVKVLVERNYKIQSFKVGNWSERMFLYVPFKIFYMNMYIIGNSTCSFPFDLLVRLNWKGSDAQRCIPSKIWKELSIQHPKKPCLVEDLFLWDP